MTDYRVHRIRFVEYTPQAIHCLAFEDSSFPRLALSRQDGTIEIWNLKNVKWTVAFEIPGKKDRSIESLVWCKGRLFSAGLNGEIIEWDLKKLDALESLDSFGGPVWCMAADHARTKLAAGCEDGGLRLYEVLHKGVQFVVALDKQEGRILSLAWGHNDDVIVTGGADSTIRLYNVKTKRVTLRMTADKQRGIDTLVWDVYLTKDMTIVTGDSLGQTQFWDAKHGTLLQSFKSHQADVLTLCVNKAEDTVYSSGIDSRVAQFRLLKGEKSLEEWKLTRRVRAVNHDIRALATIDTPFPILVSGGVDPRLIKYKTKLFDGTGFFRMSMCPQKNICKIASKADLLVYQDKHSINVWKLQDLTNAGNMEAPQKLLEVTSSRADNIICSAVSEDGSLIAYADISNLRLFEVKYDKSNVGKQTLSLSRISSLAGDIKGVQLMQITSDNSKLIFANSEGIHAINLHSSNIKKLELPENISSEGPWISLSVSKNNRLVALMDCDFKGNIFDLVEMKHIVQIPTLDCQPTCMTFHPTANRLCITCAEKEVHIFDVEHGKFTKWSIELNNSKLLKDLPTHSSLFTNILFNTLNHDEIFLQSDKGFVKVDTAVNILSKTNEEGKECEVYKRKRKSAASDIAKSCVKYQPVLHLDFLEDGSLVVVERPTVDMLGALPPAMKIKKFGT